MKRVLDVAFAAYFPNETVSIRDSRFNLKRASETMLRLYKSLSPNQLKMTYLFALAATHAARLQRFSSVWTRQGFELLQAAIDDWVVGLSVGEQAKELKSYAARFLAIGTQYVEFDTALISSMTRLVGVPDISALTVSDAKEAVGSAPLVNLVKIEFGVLTLILGSLNVQIDAARKIPCDSLQVCFKEILEAGHAANRESTILDNAEITQLIEFARRQVRLDIAVPKTQRAFLQHVNSVIDAGFHSFAFAELFPSQVMLQLIAVSLIYIVWCDVRRLQLDTALLIASSKGKRAHQLPSPNDVSVLIATAVDTMQLPAGTLRVIVAYSSLRDYVRNLEGCVVDFGNGARNVCLSPADRQARGASFSELSRAVVSRLESVTAVLPQWATVIESAATADELADIVVGHLGYTSASAQLKKLISKTSWSRWKENWTRISAAILNLNLSRDTLTEAYRKTVMRLTEAWHSSLSDMRVMVTAHVPLQLKLLEMLSTAFTGSVKGRSSRDLFRETVVVTLESFIVMTTPPPREPGLSEAYWQNIQRVLQTREMHSTTLWAKNWVPELQQEIRQNQTWSTALLLLMRDINRGFSLS
jgi:hypothetical protein